LSTVASAAGLTEEDLQVEYRALLQFLHLAPVGLVRARLDGEIVLMNPKATMLLAPLGFGDGIPNLFDILKEASPDLRMLVDAYSRSTGIVCENFPVPIPNPGPGPEDVWSLGVTILRLSSDPQTIMVVISDRTADMKLRRLQSGWMS
jgi:hypothetical protein